MKQLLNINLFLIALVCIFTSCDDKEETPAPAPEADFTFQVGDDGIVTFTNTSTNATSYVWNFGDTATSTEQSPSHTYTASGTYDVKLTATGEGGTDEATKEVTITIEPETSQIEITYDITRPAADGYTGTLITVSEDEKEQIAAALGLSMDEIIASLTDEDGTVAFEAIEGTEIYEGEPTANGYGHWFAADGTVIAWGADARVYSEFDHANFVFAVGHFPDQAVAGDEYTIKQALIHGEGQVTFVFNVTIE